MRISDWSSDVCSSDLANCYTALEQNLEVLPVLNKVDLQNAEPDRVCDEIEQVIGVSATDAIRVSAKTGLNVLDVLEMVVERLPPPKRSEERRVGTECDRKCRARWSPYHYKKKR